MNITKASVKLRRIILERFCCCWILNIEKNADPVVDKMDDSGDEEMEIEMEYMPHWWSTKYETPDEVLLQYIQFITAGSEVAINTIPHELDVPYGGSSAQKLDIFGIELPDDAPIVVYIYGGNWMEISKDISRFPAISLHLAGVKTIVVGYDQGPHVTLWDIVEQMEDAIIYVMKYAEEKKSRGVYLAGHGSGAHLIAQVLSNYELFDCQAMKSLNGVFLISGLYDLRDFSLTTANDAIKISKMDEISFSPLFQNYNHLEDSSIRFYILAAEEDSVTFKSQGREFYDLLFDICSTKNMYFEVKSNTDHFDMVKCLTNEDNYLKQLILHDLQKHGR